MELVAKADPHGTPLRTLSRDETSAIRAVFGEHDHESPLEADAMACAEEARDLDAWIACDCLEGQRAFLFPRRTESGGITLVRPAAPRHTPHARHCPFYLEDSSSDHQRQRDNLPADLCLLKPSVSATGSSARSPKATPVDAGTTPVIDRLLVALLHGAGMCHIGEDGLPSLNDAGARLLQAADAFPMWPGTHQRLRDYLVVHPRGRFALYRSLRNDRHFGKRRKQGYLVHLIGGVDGHVLHCLNGETIEVEGQVSVPSQSSGPYWVIGHIGERFPGSGYFTTLRASLMCAYSDRLPFPVRNEQERDFLRLLIGWRLYWQKRDGLSLSIDRPNHISSLSSFIISDRETGRQVAVGLGDSGADAGFGSPASPLRYRPGDEALTFKKRLSATIFS
jgi:hypothetical protein